MRYTIIVLVATIGLSLLWATACPAQDVVHTKDGSVFKGRIVEERVDVRLVIRDMAGNQHSIEWDNIDRIERGEWQGKKSAELSWALSFFLLPGLGQFYNGDSGKGVAMLGACAVGLRLILATKGPSPVGALIVGGDWVWSFIDAPLRSKTINRQRGYAAGHTLPLPGPYYAISLQNNLVREPSLRLSLVRVSF